MGGARYRVQYCFENLKRFAHWHCRFRLEMAFISLFSEIALISRRCVHRSRLISLFVLDAHVGAARAPRASQRQCPGPDSWRTAPPAPSCRTSTDATRSTPRDSVQSRMPASRGHEGPVSRWPGCRNAGRHAARSGLSRSHALGRRWRARGRAPCTASVACGRAGRENRRRSFTRRRGEAVASRAMQASQKDPAGRSTARRAHTW